MNIQEIRNTLDNLYRTESMEIGYEYLIEQLQRAMSSQEDDVVLGILNEMLGYYRVTGKFELGETIAKKANVLVSVLHLENTVAGATTYLNIATFYSVAKKLSLAEQYYQKTMYIYQQQLDNKDERIASLYNNMSIFYHQSKQYTKAYKVQHLAINIISLLPDCQIELATSYTNLAEICFSLHRYQEGFIAIHDSISLFETYGKKDVHYPGAIATLASGYFLKKQYQNAIDNYQKAIDIIESLYGKCDSYFTLLKNKEYVEQVYENSKQKGMGICRQYFEEVAKPLLQSQFKEIYPKMTIGLVGQGSECLGFDDIISRDHDFGSGFCIWLDDGDFHKYGASLRSFYQSLPTTFNGLTRNTSLRGNFRVGVFNTRQFYYQFIGKIPSTLLEWLTIDETMLATCTNGEIFHEGSTSFINIRNTLLDYYPEDVRIKKIVARIAKMAQSGQYNYARCMQRKEYVAASLAIHEFIEATISCIYLLNRQYMPFYKWAHHGLQYVSILSSLYQDLETLALLPCQQDVWQQDANDYQSHINTEDKKVALIENICKQIVEELQKQELTSSHDEFLENHVDEVMHHIQDATIATLPIMEG